MNITIAVGKNKTSIDLDVESDIQIEESIFSFTFECDSDFSASLLADELKRSLESQLRRIRKEEYRRGYDHAKKHKPRVEWHWSGLQDRHYEDGE